MGWRSTSSNANGETPHRDDPDRHPVAYCANDTSGEKTVSEMTFPIGSHHPDDTHPDVGDSGYGKPPVIREPSHVPLVHVLRGGLIEGVHYGSVVVLAADGTVQFAAGDIDGAFYPRSAIKPLQTVGMLRAGLALADDLLALAAASHSGEEFHLAGVHRILSDAGLGESDLRNARDLPFDPVVRDEWIAAQRPASRIAQNCSGKHAAMLATARRNGWSTSRLCRPAATRCSGPSHSAWRTSPASRSRTWRSTAAAPRRSSSRCTG